MEVLKLVMPLLQALVWPAFGVFLVLIFRGPLTTYIHTLGQASLKLPGGIELSLNQVAASAAAAGVELGKQSAEQNQPVSAQAVENIASAFQPRGLVRNRPLDQTSILWVDDIPANNKGLVSAFQRLGVRVVEAISTDEAGKALAGAKFDLIISDMSRPPDHEAGKTLLALLRERRIATPVIIFAAGYAAQHRDEAHAIGALLITNDASEVYRTALNTLQRPA